MNQVTYVSSEKDRVKQSQLNNVIQSLNCFVSCTTPDTTQQDYGEICYTGPIKKGQIIKGNKKPKKAGTPVIANGAWLGNIDRNGQLIITNNCNTTSSISITEGYVDIQYQAIQDCSNPGSSCYCRGCMSLVGCCVTCTPGEDEDGPYVCVVSCCTWTQPVAEKCVFASAFRNIPDFENSCRYTIRNKTISSSCPHDMCYYYFAYCNPLNAIGEPVSCLPYHDLGDTFGIRGSYYANCGQLGYVFCDSQLFYEACYSFDSIEEMWWYCGYPDSDTAICQDSTCRSNIGCYCSSVGPFLSGFDAETGKMQWECNPSTFTMSVSPVSNMCYTSYLCYAYGSCHCFPYCTYLSNTTACSTCVVNKYLVVCATSCYCCTLCVSSKLRAIDCVSIHERYI